MEIVLGLCPECWAEFWEFVCFALGPDTISLYSGLASLRLQDYGSVDGDSPAQP